MHLFNNLFLLRFIMAIILLAHSIPSFFNNGINDFGKLYLNEIGFAPFGLFLAWAIKLSHVAAAICFLINKWIKWASVITIITLVMGIILIHYQEGWYVVGAGRNGMEFNILMIFILLTFLFPKDIVKHPS